MRYVLLFKLIIIMYDKIKIMYILHTGTYDTNLQIFESSTGSVAKCQLLKKLCPKSFNKSP